jgi:hypothetical protein
LYELQIALFNIHFDKTNPFLEGKNRLGVSINIFMIHGKPLVIKDEEGTKVPVMQVFHSCWFIVLEDNRNLQRTLNQQCAWLMKFLSTMSTHTKLPVHSGFLDILKSLKMSQIQ